MGEEMPKCSNLREQEQDASSAFQWKSLFDAPAKSGRRGGQALSLLPLDFTVLDILSLSSCFLGLSTSHSNGLHMCILRTRVE